MDKKKLIGTIIGVTMFAALIAGATFAWLTIAVNATNGVYNGATKNFIITYAGGSAVTDTVQTPNPLTTNITSSSTAAASTTDGWLAVTASKTANSAKASKFDIRLYMTTMTFTTRALTYAVCIGACPTTVKLATVSNGTATCGNNASIVSCGTVPTTIPTDKYITLYSDTTTFNTDAAVSTTTYNIYFWIDSATIVATDVGKIFNGYIYAHATQGN